MKQKYAAKIDLWSVIAISLSSMLGAGIFVLPGIAFSLTGPSIWIAYLLAGIAILPTALSKSELASAMPSSGGTYVYLERTFGPFLGTLSGIGLWLSLLLKSAFALIGLGAYISIFFTIKIEFIAIGLLIFILALNIYGVGKISKLIKLIVVIAILSILIVVLKVFSIPAPTEVNPFNLMAGTEGLFSSIALVFISYAGVTKVAAIAGEIKNPSKNLPRGIIISLVIATFLYTLFSYALVHVIPASSLENNLISFYDSAGILFTPLVANIFGVIAIVTMTFMANAGILAASRFPYAMSKDKLLPSLFSKLSKRFGTPYPSLLITTVVAAIFILFLPIEKTAKLASGFLLFIYAMEHLSVIILRELRVQWYKPEYKSPLYPLPQIIGFFICFFLLWEMGILMVYGIIGVSLPGALLFLFYSKNKIEKKGVLGLRKKGRDDLAENPASSSSSVTTIIAPEEEVSRPKADINIVVYGKEQSPENLCEFAMTFSKNSCVQVNSVMEIPEGEHYYGSEEDTSSNSLERRLKAMSQAIEKDIYFDKIITFDIIQTLYQLSSEKGIDWIIVEAPSSKKGLLTFHNPFGWLKSELSCNLGIYKNNGIRYIKNILIYYKRDDHLEFLLDTSRFLSEYFKAGVTLLAAEPELLIERDEECRTRKIKNLDLPATERKITNLVEMSSDYDLIIFESFIPDLVHSIFSKENYVLNNAVCSVLAIRGINFNKDN
jgi:APA family basic amino acid/polyamine antiporter